MIMNQQHYIQLLSESIGLFRIPKVFRYMSTVVPLRDVSPVLKNHHSYSIDK